MKRFIAGIALFALIFASVAFTGGSGVNAQTVDLSQFRALVELFIALDIIHADKANAARIAVGLPVVETPTASTGSVTEPQSAPVEAPATNVPVQPVVAEKVYFDNLTPVIEYVTDSGIFRKGPNYIAELHRVGADVTYVIDDRGATKEDTWYVMKGRATKETYFKENGNKKNVGDIITSGQYFGYDIKAMYPSDFDKLPF